MTWVYLAGKVVGVLDLKWVGIACFHKFTYVQFSLNYMHVDLRVCRNRNGTKQKFNKLIHLPVFLSDVPKVLLFYWKIVKLKRHPCF